MAGVPSGGPHQSVFAGWPVKPHSLQAKQNETKFR
jgi:hypothetical protein